MKTEVRQYKIDWVAIFVSFAILAAIVILTIVSPDRLLGGLDSVRHVLIYNFGAYFIVFTAVILFYSIYLAFSKYGNIRFGRTKPQYSNFGWISMIFCAAMGCTILFWSGIEWAYYTVWLHPFGMSAEETASISVAYSFFHWGPPAWAIYAAGVVPIAYRYYNRKRPGLTLQGGCEGVLGKHAHGALGTVISIIFVFGVLGGYAISYGSGIPMLNNILHNLLGTPESLLIDFILIAAVTALFCWSACSGVAKGIQVLSKICVILCFVICGCFLVLGHTGFQINNTVESVGILFDNFFRWLFYVDPTGASGGFPQEWTVFYWAWWLGLAPVMWVFIAKCSAGRSIRSLILTVIISGTAATIMFFGTISNHGLGEIILGGFDWSNLGSNGTY
ncbi:MAG: BCCT family transporter, partial [Clostridia bacterium]